MERNVSEAVTNWWGSPMGYDSIIVTKHQGCAQCFPFPKRLSHTGLQIQRALGQLRAAEYAALLIVIQWRWNRCYLLVNSNAVAIRHKHILYIGPNRSPLFPKRSQLECQLLLLSLVLLSAAFQSSSRQLWHEPLLWAAARVTKSPGSGSSPRGTALLGPKEGSCQDVVRPRGPRRCAALHKEWRGSILKKRCIAGYTGEPSG